MDKFAISIVWDSVHFVPIFIKILRKFLQAHAQNVGDAAKVPIGRRSRPIRVENMELDQIQNTISNTLKKKTIKVEQGDSVVSTETLRDVKSQQIRGFQEFFVSFLGTKKCVLF